MAAGTDTEEYCSTREAAQRLGVSLGTVQNMVEAGKLTAWKTAGGHRRISVRAVESYLAQRAGKAVPDERVKLLVAEDEPILQALYRHAVENWDMPVDLTIVGNGYEGMIEIGLSRPHLLIADLNLPGLDGFEMIRTIRAQEKLADMNIIVVSGLTPEEIESRGGLPQDVTVYGKPVPFHELRGYVQALVSQRQKTSR